MNEPCGERSHRLTEPFLGEGGIFMEGHRGRQGEQGPHLRQRSDIPPALRNVGLLTWLEGVGRPKFMGRQGQ